MAFVDGVWERESWLPPMEWTPAQEWAKITARQDPYWETRAPMRQLGTQLQARYLLGAPRMGQEDWGREPTFEDYIGSFIGGQPEGDPVRASDSLAHPWTVTTPGANPYEALMHRARAAAEATRQPMGEYMAGFTPDTDAWRTAAWYGSQFNPLQAQRGAAEANQLAVATLLAQQRQGAGAVPYTGAMGSAIADAVAAQQQYQQDIGRPTGSFLDWYVGQLPT